MNEKSIKLVSVFLIFLIIFICLTTFFNDDEEEIEETQTDTIILDQTNEYKNELQEEILKMLNKMEGVGDVEVMITIENGLESVYVTEENFTTDIQIDSQKRTGEQTTLLVEDANGRRQALLKMTIQPVVRGVVVVCEGGDDILVVARVTQAIKALLNISSTKIYVTN